LLREPAEGEWAVTYSQQISSRLIETGAGRGVDNPGSGIADGTPSLLSPGNDILQQLHRLPDHIERWQHQVLVLIDSTSS
jgi:hypothetical protein